MPYKVLPNQILRKQKRKPISVILESTDNLNDVKGQREIKRYKKSVRVKKITREESFDGLSREINNRSETWPGSGTVMHNISSFYYTVENAHRFHEYRVYRIPKKSGGYRTIKEPSGTLKTIQRRGVKYLFRNLWQPRSSQAFAFSKHRSTVDALKRHTMNKSRWYMKIDLKDFFESTNIDTIMKQLSRIYPYSAYFELFPTKRSLMKRSIEDTFMDNGGLPQGAPSSPVITNVIMIPFDYEFNKWCKENGYVYTRYADDMIISHKDHFDYHEVVNKVTELLSELEYPYQVNEKKTRYGSYKGRNINLGLVCNGNYDITIGHKTKKQFKAMLVKLIDNESNEYREHCQGLYAYYHKIEPEYIDYIIDKYNKKFNVDFKQLMYNKI